MKFSLRKTAEALLACAALILLAVAVLPWPSEQPIRLENGSGSAPPADSTEKRAPQIHAEVDAVLSLFVTRSAPRASAPAPAVQAPVVQEMKKPVEAPWLNYLGYSSGAEGKPFYFFKDTRSGRVVKVAQGEVSNGWAIVEVTDNRIVIRNNDDVYTVKR